MHARSSGACAEAGRLRQELKRYTRRMGQRRSCLGLISGCLAKLALMGIALCAFGWLLLVVLNPWALHIGGRSTTLLYWHGTGTVVAANGKSYPFYATFWPGKPGRGQVIGRREGKGWSANIGGNGWLCIAPGSVERMTLSGTMYGGYTSSADSLFDFRFLEWRKPFSINPPIRGFFDVAGMWHGDELVMDRPNEQGIPLKTGPYIDRAKVTLRWASYKEFEEACNGR